jgi:predicted RNA binding protein YcfA (HicA-like mRNA interferase family)
MDRLGFDLRIRGSHHIFTKDQVDEIIPDHLIPWLSPK